MKSFFQSLTRSTAGSDSQISNSDITSDKNKNTSSIGQEKENIGDDSMKYQQQYSTYENVDLDDEDQVIRIGVVNQDAEHEDEGQIQGNTNSNVNGGRINNDPDLNHDNLHHHNHHHHHKKIDGLHVDLIQEQVVVKIQDSDPEGPTDSHFHATTPRPDQHFWKSPSSALNIISSDSLSSDSSDDNDDDDDDDDSDSDDDIQLGLHQWPPKGSGPSRTSIEGVLQSITTEMPDKDSQNLQKHLDSLVISSNSKALPEAQVLTQRDSINSIDSDSLVFVSAAARKMSTHAAIDFDYDFTDLEKSYHAPNIALLKLVDQSHPNSLFSASLATKPYHVRSYSTIHMQRDDTSAFKRLDPVQAQNKFKTAIESLTKIDYHSSTTNSSASSIQKTLDGKPLKGIHTLDIAGVPLSDPQTLQKLIDTLSLPDFSLSSSSKVTSPQHTMRHPIGWLECALSSIDDDVFEKLIVDSKAHQSWLSQVHHIGFQGNALTDRSVDTWIKAWQATSEKDALHSLNLANNQISDAAIDQLFSVILSDSQVRSLSLQGNQITDHGISLIISHLKQAAKQLEQSSTQSQSQTHKQTPPRLHLRKLNLSGNPFRYLRVLELEKLATDYSIDIFIEGVHQPHPHDSASEKSIQETASRLREYIKYGPEALIQKLSNEANPSPVKTPNKFAFPSPSILFQKLAFTGTSSQLQQQKSSDLTPHQLIYQIFDDFQNALRSTENYPPVDGLVLDYKDAPSNIAKYALDFIQSTFSTGMDKYAHKTQTREHQLQQAFGSTGPFALYAMEALVTVLKSSHCRNLFIDDALVELGVIPLALRLFQENTISNMLHNRVLDLVKISIDPLRAPLFCAIFSNDQSLIEQDKGVNLIDFILQSNWKNLESDWSLCNTQHIAEMTHYMLEKAGENDIVRKFIDANETWVDFDQSGALDLLLEKCEKKFNCAPHPRQVMPGHHMMDEMLELNFQRLFGTNYLQGWY